MNFDYDEFRRDKLTEKINEEIAFYEQSEYAKIYIFRDYITYLKTRIGRDKEVETGQIYRYDRIGNKCEITRMNLDEHVKNVTDQLYMRPWTKMKEFHKMVKIKEFVNDLEYDANEKVVERNRLYLIKELCDGVKQKKFTKNRHVVEYDNVGMKILSISCLVHKKGLYRVYWD